MFSNEAIHQQVENLLSQMTLEEKVAQTLYQSGSGRKSGFPYTTGRIRVAGFEVSGY